MKLAVYMTALLCTFVPVATAQPPEHNTVKIMLTEGISTAMARCAVMAFTSATVADVSTCSAKNDLTSCIMPSGQSTVTLAWRKGEAAVYLAAEGLGRPALIGHLTLTTQLDAHLVMGLSLTAPAGTCRIELSDDQILHVVWTPPAE